MQEVFRDILKVRSSFNSNFINIPVAFIPFAAMLSGVFLEKGLSVKTAISLCQSIEHLYSSKKVITKEEYTTILKALYSNPYEWQKIQENVLIPKAAKQNVNVDAQIGYLINAGISNTIPLDEDTESLHQLINQQEDVFQVQRQSSRKRKQEEQKRTMQLIAQLQKQDEEMLQKSEGQKNECLVCQVGLYQQNMIPFPLENCGHVFHTQCLQGCLNAQIAERKFPLKCPNDQCKKEILERDIKQILTVQNLLKYQQFSLKNYLDMNSDSVSWCPTAGCKYVFFFSAEDPVRFQCLECHKQYCLNCKIDWHSDMTCKQYQVSSNFSQDDKKFIKYVTGAQYKQCPKCKFWVSKTQGCDHMVCRCKYEFCYKCGGKFMDCECTKQAQRRMQQRRNNAQKRRSKAQAKKEALEAARKARQEYDSDQDEQVPAPRRGRSKRK